ncbi:conserved hypothetical protein [Theileria orientalis strain Shintoku]|uniref:Uncharacterized protein n=1 Tax=Theileria orientalis strain Shintoku TaxID=869250 RepID=J7M8R3_THEOR|nr:conserved hypothetical protein [Theileria orientalis strain Shintoku]PVC49828.1 hypothetical protein MACL_00002712 [Theileria orientalis]BAM42498.1 conserved hypothetical protein [Theileria orientalis strain Shintoku]|eukprot:XP_009692799.1 conserved hypothetical protein [Theileria orientalis strain Shintoku]
MMILAQVLLIALGVLGLQLTQAHNPDFPNALKIITDGSSEPNDTTKFTVERSYSRVDYVFIPGANCTEIRFGDRCVWKSGDKDVKDPVSIAYVTDINQLAVRQKHISVIYNEGIGTNWQFAYVVDNETGKVFATEEGEKWRGLFLKLIMVSISLSLFFLLNPFILGLLIYLVKVTRDIRSYVSNGPEAPLLP